MANIVLELKHAAWMEYQSAKEMSEKLANDLREAEQTMDTAWSAFCRLSYDGDANKADREVLL